ncbi:hypothetical protein PRZ48_000030 [Zasmidium cellare]|uniref:Uncharacterized protein n=1 Tax=Zasmidium cellare TaxID=395010 RepID=A0ABR0EXX7_ZASCE|nr:hypothetical protein PRZ48_000030 [Zasmidium cellare]
MAGFRGIVEAQDALRAIIETTFTGIHSFAAEGRNDDIEATLRSGIAYLQDWKAAYDRTIGQWLHGTHREALLPQILWQTALSVLRTIVSVNNLPSDEEFAENVGMCEAFMQLHGTTADEGDAFFVDHAVIPGLFFAAVQCKESTLSARAVQALRQRRWREGSRLHPGAESSVKGKPRSQESNESSNQHCSAPNGDRQETVRQDLATDRGAKKLSVVKKG